MLTVRKWLDQGEGSNCFSDQYHSVRIGFEQLATVNSGRYHTRSNGERVELTKQDLVIFAFRKSISRLGVPAPAPEAKLVANPFDATCDDLLEDPDFAEVNPF